MLHFGFVYSFVWLISSLANLYFTPFLKASVLTLHPPSKYMVYLLTSLLSCPTMLSSSNATTIAVVATLMVIFGIVKPAIIALGLVLIDGGAAFQDLFI